MPSEISARAQSVFLYSNESVPSLLPCQTTRCTYLEDNWIPACAGMTNKWGMNSVSGLHEVKFYLSQHAEAFARLCGLTFRYSGFPSTKSRYYRISRNAGRKHHLTPVAIIVCHDRWTTRPFCMTFGNSRSNRPKFIPPNRTGHLIFQKDSMKSLPFYRLDAAV